MKKKLVIASGYFNPLHIGHIEYLKESKKLGDKLIVIVNNDKQRVLKKSKEFFNQDERCIIISNLKDVDEVFLSIDNTRSVKKSILMIYTNNKENYDFIFTNGGDQFFSESPEYTLCKELNICVKDGLGEKIQSSSRLLSKL